MNRREFMVATAASGIALATGQPIRAAVIPERNGSPYMKLSLAGYSFNRFLKRRPAPEEAAKAKMSLEDFIDFCAKMDLDGCEPTSYYFPAQVTYPYLQQIKHQAFRLGLDISGTAIGNDFCVPYGEQWDAQVRDARRWIEYAGALGAPAIRFFAGNVPKGDTEDAALERCVHGLNECLKYAPYHGVFVALENHGGITATPEQLLRIVENVTPSPWFGINFDSGNFRTDDPYRDLEKIAPYTVNAQIKVNIHKNGVEEPADFGRIISILKDADYRGYVVLEYEGKEDPFEAIPGHLKRLRKLIS
jgi:sugar phosphate isomerase/epimerase